MKGSLFYCPKDQKVIVSTNARFLEDDYVMNQKPRSKIVLEELRGDRPSHNSYKKKYHKIESSTFHCIVVVGGML